MGALKIVGGILAVVGAGLILFVQISGVITGDFDIELVIYNMILPIVALIGGILALVGKRVGGILALVVGIIWFTMALLYNLGLSLSMPNELSLLLIQIPEVSFFLNYLSFAIWPLFLTVEIILVLVGGILATAGGSDK